MFFNLLSQLQSFLFHLNVYQEQNGLLLLFSEELQVVFLLESGRFELLSCLLLSLYLLPRKCSSHRRLNFNDLLFFLLYLFPRQLASDVCLNLCNFVKGLLSLSELFFLGLLLKRLDSIFFLLSNQFTGQTASYASLYLDNVLLFLNNLLSVSFPPVDGLDFGCTLVFFDQMLNLLPAHLRGPSRCESLAH